MLPEDLQSQVLAAHGDLFHRHDRGFVTTRIRHGTSDVATVVDAPFGVAYPFDPSRFTPLAEWTFS
jgi:hypothetical protein